MNTPFEHSNSQRHEREIRSLSDRSGASVAQVRTLFSDEFARLKEEGYEEYLPLFEKAAQQ